MDKFNTTPLINSIRSALKPRYIMLPACLALSLNLHAETYNFNFNRSELPTYGDTPLSGSGDYNLFNFSESFQFGISKNPKINLGFKKINLGTYGFEASGYVNGNANLAYDYDLGEHSYNLNLPMNVDLNVSSIDANNQITITSAYTLGSQSAINPTIDTTNAFFNVDPTFQLAAGLNAKACAKDCWNIINEHVSVDASQDNLIDIHADDLRIKFDKESSNSKVGAELSKTVGIFGVDLPDDSEEIVGNLARSFGLLGLTAHTPGLEFTQTPGQEIQFNHDDSFSLASSGEDEFFSLNIDMVDFAASATLGGVGKTLTKLLDKELSANIGGQQLVADWELVDIEATTSAALKQNVEFRGTPTIDLALSNGENISINAGESIVIQLEDGVENIDVTPTFNMAGDFYSELALKLDASVDMNLMGYNFDLPLSKIGVGHGFNLGKFGVGNINKFHEPEYSRHEITEEVSLFSLERELQGFSAITGQTISTKLSNASEIGTHGDDILRGSSGDNTIVALAGNDILTGGLGNDVLNGGLGTDTADYQSYTDGDGDHLQSGNGVTVHLFSNTATSTRANNPGIIDTDTLISIENVSGSDLNDNINGNNENNVLKGRDGDDALRGYAGNDIIYGGNGDDLIRGGNGNDILEGGEGLDNIFGGNGDDLIIVQPERHFSDAVNGGDGNDTIKFVGEDESTVVLENLFFKKVPYTKGVYVDLLSGTANSYVSPGTNQLLFSKLPTVFFDGFKLDGLNRMTNGTMSITNVENVVGTFFQDVIIGDNENNIIDGGNNFDRLYGGGGDDTFVYSQGNDHYDGGEGIDTIDASDFNNIVEIDLNSLTSVENIRGSREEDILTGDENNNIIDGFFGSDIMVGNGGDDIFIVHNSNPRDTNEITGGTGVDTVVLTEAVEQQQIMASFNNDNLELTINADNRVILQGQYSTPEEATESLYNNIDSSPINISGSFEQLVSAGDFNYYNVASDFSTSEDMTVVTQLETEAQTTLTNQHTLTNESTLIASGKLVNKGTLVNEGILIIEDSLENEGTFNNTETGRTHYTTSSSLSGFIHNDGLIDVLAGETLSITGEYYGSGFLLGDIHFDEVAMNIGNSPGTTNLFGLASFNNVDFNLEIGQDSFGSIEYDNFNVFGDFILGQNLTVSLSLLDGLGFEDLIDIDFNFITVSERIFDLEDFELSIADLLDYKVEIIDGFFANWYFQEDLGYSLSFNGTDLYLATGGILPTDVPEPGTLGLFAMAGGLIFMRRRKALTH